MWLNIAAKLVPGIIKTGMSIASNRRKTKELESVAELKMAERMANGEVEFKKAVINSHRGDWKDEFCLILISIPLLLLAWSVFSDDPNIQQKIDIFFIRPCKGKRRIVVFLPRSINFHIYSRL